MALLVDRASGIKQFVSLNGISFIRRAVAQKQEDSRPHPVMPSLF